VTRPVIGLTTYAEEARFGVQDTFAAVLPLSYVHAVHVSGGRAVLVTPDDPDADVLDGLDGIMFTGGSDVDPELYGEHPHPTTMVKPDMVTAYSELIQKEAIPAYKKAGIPFRWVFANGPVGPGATFVSAQPIRNYADFDQGPVLRAAMGPDIYAKYLARLRPMLLSTHGVIQTLVANASIQSFSGKPPAWVIVATTQLLPGRGAEYASITTNEFLPAFKKAGVTDSWMFAANFGAPVTQRTIVTPIAGWADLDQPGALARALGPEAAQKLNQKRAALTTSTESVVMRYVPELSYGTPTRPAGTAQ